MASSASVSSLLTAEDYRTMTPPEGMGPRYELIEGELIEVFSPNLFHQKILMNLLRLIDHHIQQQALGELYCAPLDVYLDDFNVFQPDIIFISSARAPAVLRPEGVVGAPDLAVEILSPSTEARDRRVKRPVLARSGTRELWLVDPATRRVEVYDLVANPDQPTAAYGESDVLQTPLLPGLVIPLREVFAHRFG
jgi:Uma2 family endonuclease